jgi:hypothetical protein
LINIKNKIKISEKIYENDYKRFLDFVASNNVFQKEHINKIKKITYETGIENNKENRKNKKL